MGGTGRINESKGVMGGPDEAWACGENVKPSNEQIKCRNYGLVGLDVRR